MFSKSMKRGLAAAIGLFLGAGVFAAAEVFLRLLPRDSSYDDIVIDGEGEFYVQSPDKWWHKKNASRRAIARLHDRTIYDVVYQTDSWGRRRTRPLDDSIPRRPERFLAFFGCSFTFGEGLGQEDTFPFILAQRHPERAVYNYGVAGYGPQMTLKMVESGDLQAQIPQKIGAFAFVFHLATSSGHLERLIGTPFMSPGWRKNLLNYELGADGLLVQKGNLWEHTPLLVRQLPRMQSSLLFRRSGIERWWPQPYTPENLDKLARVFDQTRNGLRKQFPQSQFVVIFHPFSQGELGDMLVPYLDKYQIAYRRFERPDWREDSSYRVPIDGHPNGKLNREFAKSMDARWLKGS